MHSKSADQPPHSLRRFLAVIALAFAVTGVARADTAPVVLEPDGEEFRIELPGPVETHRSGAVSIYMWSDGETQIAVQSIEDDEIESLPPEQALDAFAIGYERSFATSSAQVGDTARLRLVEAGMLDGYPMRTYAFQSDGRNGVVRMYVCRRHVYAVLAIGPDTSQETIARSLSSMRLNAMDVNRAALRPEARLTTDVAD